MTSSASTQQLHGTEVDHSHAEDEGGDAFSEEQPLPAVQAADAVERQQARRQGRTDDLRNNVARLGQPHTLSRLPIHQHAGRKSRQETQRGLLQSCRWGEVMPG